MSNILHPLVFKENFSMCGIHAILGQRVSESQIQKMLATTQHRGPNRDSWLACPGAALAINRLSINDIDHGHQPFVSDDKTILLVCNGEIYNAPAIRNNLEDTQFNTGSDAEVLLHLYRRHGPALLNEIDGMFAFVIFDQNTGTVFAARDPFGIKPLYFHYTDETLYLASEMKSLLTAGIAIEDIQQVPPGHRLYGKPTADLKPEPWYSLDTHRVRSMPSPVFLRSLLDHAVQKHLLRDPGLRVGVFLSGGLDSSVLAALAARHCPDLVAFSVGMPGSPDVEAAQKVAAHLGIELVICQFSIEQALAAIPKAIWHVESYNRTVVFETAMTMMLAETAHKAGIKIVLCGEGADDIFAGYTLFRTPPRTQVETLQRDAMSTIVTFDCLRLDRGTMAHSVEARVPFLDRQVVNYALNLPVDALLKKTPEGIIEKYALREAAVGLLPDEIIWRKKAVFEKASGILDVIDKINETVSDEELVTAQHDFPGANLQSKLAVALYSNFRTCFGSSGQAKAYDMFGSWKAVGSYADRGTTASAYSDSI